MTPFAVDAAARYLADARSQERPLARLPESCRPETIDEALVIQRRVATLLGDAIGGWKCALPSPERTIVAPIYAATISTMSPCAVRARDGTARVEPEIAFVLGRDL